MNVMPGTSAGPFPPQPDLNVVVWEWQDEFGRWRPYRSGVCSYIEQSFQTLTAKGRRSLGALPGNSSIPLGHADSALSPYVIDILSLTQFRQDTGTMRTVRRLVFPLDSAAGQGVIWEWQNDEAGWFPYEMNICVYLEKALSCHSPQADLGHLGYNYQIDFASYTQTNKMTGYQRRVRRCVDSPYPVAAAYGPSHAGPTCSCQQCLLNKRTGPITSRYRHSMVNLPGPSAGTVPRPFPSTQGANGTPGLGSSFVGFVPYSKPALAGARSVPWLNVQSLGATLQLTTISGAIPSHRAAKGISVPKLPVSMTQPSRLNQALAVSTSCPEDLVKQYLEELRTPPADEDCIICMEKLNVPSGYSDVCESKTIRPESVGRLSKCNHTFHHLCVLAMYTSGNKDGSLQCPSCKTIYGEKTGTQPDGKMDVSMLPDSLPGHEGCGSIQIAYYINKGIQGPGHPNPGQPYTARGFPRYCYLPNNEKGRKVLELLRVAWKRRLIFTVGTSSTTGENNTVVWNEIHHKTEMTSNLSGHGFPDPNYLDNVLAELAAQGVTEDCLRA